MRNNSLLIHLSNKTYKQSKVFSDFSDTISYTLFISSFSLIISKMIVSSVKLMTAMLLIEGNLFIFKNNRFLCFTHLVEKINSLFVSSQLHSQLLFNWVNSTMNQGNNLSRVCLRGVYESGIDRI